MRSTACSARVVRVLGDFADLPTCSTVNACVSRL
jgi:hypothetical protein